MVPKILMSAFMVSLIAFSRECPLAIPALVRFLASVSPHVVSQTRPLRKSLATTLLCANVWLYPKVNVPVSTQR